MRWRPRLGGRAANRALGLLVGPPTALASLRWRARAWGAEGPEEVEEQRDPGLPPERWAQLQSLAERASLMRSGRIDLAAIRRWHSEHGFTGAITLREWPADCAERYSPVTGVSDRERRECYYVYHEPAGSGGKCVQQIFVRGTCVPEDCIENILVAKDWDPELGCQLHHGFRRRASQVFESLEPLLDSSAEITLSGHSLGGAVATIVGMRLHARGYNVREVVTFGAPKVTDKAGARSHHFRTRVLRVTNLLDPVPLLPFGFCTPFSGPFSQLGAQVLLLPPGLGFAPTGCNAGGPAFVFLEPEAAAAPWVTSFLLHAQPLSSRQAGCPGWLDMHRMWSYRRLLEPLVAAPQTARRVPFSRRFTQNGGGGSSMPSSMCAAAQTSMGAGAAAGEAPPDATNPACLRLASLGS